MRPIDADTIPWIINQQYPHIAGFETVMKMAVDNMPTIDHIYGYPIKDLIIFADVCRKQNISNEDLKDFSRNTALIYEHIQKDFFDNLQKNVSYYWTEKEEE